MNRLFSDGPQGKLMLCVLEPGNIHRLLEDRAPIELDLNEPPFERGLPAKLKVILAYSETPIADQRAIEKHLAPGAFKMDLRTPRLETSRPHCPECRSTIEQLGVWRSNDSPVWIAFCSACGCVFGTMPPIAALQKGQL